MTNMPNGVAPTGQQYKIGAKGGKVGLAWQQIWDRLGRENYQDAVELSQETANRVGIKSVSIMSHLHRMAAEGLLDSTVRYSDVMVTKFGKTYPARRKRTWVRIPAEVEDQAA